MKKHCKSLQTRLENEYVKLVGLSRHPCTDYPAACLYLHFPFNADNCPTASLVFVYNTMHAILFGAV